MLPSKLQMELLLLTNALQFVCSDDDLVFHHVSASVSGLGRLCSNPNHRSIEDIWQARSVRTSDVAVRRVLLPVQRGGLPRTGQRGAGDSRPG